jgi:hypothetical protein
MGICCSSVFVVKLRVVRVDAVACVAAASSWSRQESSRQESSKVVIPAQAEIHFDLRC